MCVCVCVSVCLYVCLCVCVCEHSHVAVAGPNDFKFYTIIAEVGISLSLNFQRNPTPEIWIIWIQTNKNTFWPISQKLKKILTSNYFY